MGGQNEPPLFLDEYAAVTWSEELECYLCTVSPPEEQSQENTNETLGGSLGGVEAELGKEFSIDPTWPGEASLLGDIGCLEKPMPKKKFQ